MLLMLNYVHSHGVVHRDVKPENLVYDKKGSNHLKLIDFGYSEKWSPASEAKLKSIAGTVHYAAPEVLLQKGHTSKCDLWSLGVVGFCLLSGGMPFSGGEWNMREKICRGQYVMKPDRWNHVSEDAHDFIKSLLTVDPIKRLSAKEALEHPWIHKSEVSAPAGIVEALEALRDFACVPKCRCACMKMLASFSLDLDLDEATARDLFLWLAACDEGTITMERLSNALDEQLHVAGEDQARHIFGAISSKRGQEIAYSDFMGAMLSARTRPSEDLLRFAFECFDREGSGFISISDLCAAFDSDVDIHSCSARMSFDNFVAYFLDRPSRSACIVDQRHKMISLKNVLAAWREGRCMEDAGSEHRAEALDSGSQQADVESNIGKHGELKDHFQLAPALEEIGFENIDFAGLKRLADIRFELCRFGC